MEEGNGYLHAGVLRHEALNGPFREQLVVSFQKHLVPLVHRELNITYSLYLYAIDCVRLGKIDDRWDHFQLESVKQLRSLIQCDHQKHHASVLDFHVVPSQCRLHKGIIRFAFIQTTLQSPTHTKHMPLDLS